MRKHFGKKLGAIIGAAIVVVVLSAGAVFAAPVLQPGQTSAPGMSGTCTNCHTYAKPAQPVLFSRPAAKAMVKRGRTFSATGYVDPSICTSAAVATVTVSVERKNSKGKWVAQPSLRRTATVTDGGKYAGKVNYSVSYKIRRLGKYRLRAKLVYLDADSVSQVKWSKTTGVTIKK